MSTAIWNLPYMSAELRPIFDRAQSLIAARDEYVVTEKRVGFDRRMSIIHNELRANWPDSEENSPPIISKYINDIAKEVRKSSNGNWMSVEPLCREIWRTQERMVRRLEMRRSKSKEDYIQTLWWMAEKGTWEDLNLVQQARENPPYNSEDVSSLLAKVEAHINKRISDSCHPNTPAWFSACLGAAHLSIHDRMVLLTEILNSKQNERDALARLAGERTCESIFRCAAINRLTLTEPTPNTIAFLKGLFSPDEPDENLRAAAYMAYQYLITLPNNDVDNIEREKGKGNNSEDPSPRVRWLKSLDV